MTTFSVVAEKNRMLTAWSDGSLIVRDTTTGETLAQTGSGSPVSHCQLAGDLRHALTLSADGKLRLWDFSQRPPLPVSEVLTEGFGEISGLRFSNIGNKILILSPDGVRLLSAGLSGAAKFFPLEGAGQIRESESGGRLAVMGKTEALIFPNLESASRKTALSPVG